MRRLLRRLNLWRRTALWRPWTIRRDGCSVQIGRWWYSPFHLPVPSIQGGTNIFALTQGAFRFYEDGAENTSSAVGAQSANITRIVAANSQLQLRIRMDETGAGNVSGATTDDYQLQYSKNGGGYTNVTGASSNIRGFASANTTDAGSATQRLGGAGTYSGEVSEDGLVDDFQITGNGNGELLYVLEVVAADVAQGDTFDFRVLLNGATTNVTYSVTPRLTTLKKALGQVESSMPSMARIPMAAAASIIAAATVGTLLTTTLAPAQVVESPKTYEQVVPLISPRTAPPWEPPNLLVSTLAPVQAQPPFRALDYPNPQIPSRVHGRDPSNLLGTTLRVVETLPFRQPLWPTPPRRPVLITLTTTYSGDIPAAPVVGDPFKPFTWPTPAAKYHRASRLPAQSERGIIDQLVPYHAIDTAENVAPFRPKPRPVAFDAPNTTLALASQQVQAPFKPVDHGTPRGKRANQPLSQTSARPFYYDEGKPQKQADWPNPTVAKRPSVTADPENLLTTTLAVAAAQPPFKREPWTNPQRPIRVPVADPPNRLVWLVQLPPVRPTQQAPQSWARRTPATETPNLLGTTLAQTQAPFKPVDVSFIRSRVGAQPQVLQNLLGTTLAQVQAPFSQRDWATPFRPLYRQIEIARSFLTAIPVPIVRQTDWPNPQRPKQPALSWAVDLVRSTLAPIPPNRQSDWPNPTVRKPALHQTWSHERPSYYVEPSDFPPGDIAVSASYTPTVELRASGTGDVTLPGSTTSTIDLEGSVNG